MEEEAEREEKEEKVDEEEVPNKKGAGKHISFLEMEKKH